MVPARRPIVAYILLDDLERIAKVWHKISRTNGKASIGKKQDYVPSRICPNRHDRKATDS
jgi:hypothetical protein